MSKIKEDAERIMKETLLVISILEAAERSTQDELTADDKHKLMMLLADILRLSKQILADEKEALARIKSEAGHLIEDQEVLARLGLQYEKLFGG